MNEKSRRSSRCSGSSRALGCTVKPISTVQVLTYAPLLFIQVVIAVHLFDGTLGVQTHLTYEYV